MVLACIEIKQVMVDLDSVPHKLDAVAVFEVVVMNMECLTALRDRTARVFWNGNGAKTNVVIQFIVFIVLERKLHREIGFDGVVMNVAANSLPHLDPVKLTLRRWARSYKAIVEYFAVGHPACENAAAVTPSFKPG